MSGQSQDGFTPTGTIATAVDRRRVVFATVVGTTVEWYDFFIYATAVGLVFGQLFFEPLGAAADRRDVEVAAFGAGARHALGEAAVVAAQAAVELVEDAPGAAVRAAALPTAVAAVQHRRVAAAVQEDEALLAGVDALLQRREQRR